MKMNRWFTVIISICCLQVCSILGIDHFESICMYVIRVICHQDLGIITISDCLRHQLQSVSWQWALSFIFCLHPYLEFSIIIWSHSSLLSSNSRFSLYPLLLFLFSLLNLLSRLVLHRQLSVPASCFSLQPVYWVQQLLLSSLPVIYIM